MIENLVKNVLGLTW